jgi:hypothetical protein
MSLTISSSLDWLTVSSQLQNQINKIGYNPDLSKMFKNITAMVDYLSKLEVEARRTRKTSQLEIQLEKINQSIDRLEKLLLIGLLMK